LTEYKDTYRVGDDITWTVDSNGTLKIQGIGDMYNSSENNSFLGYYADSIKSVIIGNGVTAIGDYTFYNCPGIESVTIPESVTTIGHSAFYDCTGLTNINWNVKNIVDFSYDNQIFANAGNDGEGINVVFGHSVEHIPSNLFRFCSSKIINIAIGSNVKSIGGSAFRNCTGLTSITIPECVERVGGRRFTAVNRYLKSTGMRKMWQTFILPRPCFQMQVKTKMASM